MNTDDFERKMKLRILRSDSHGITQESLEWAKKWHSLVEPTRVYLFYQESPWDFVTYVVDDKGWAIRYSGFSWGYGGEGPRGLMMLLESFGWLAPDCTLQPTPHVPGAWSITPNGIIKVEWLPPWTFPIV
jgi:hypothetical protein